VSVQAKSIKIMPPKNALIDWCCFYYFVRNSIVALLKALCARFTLCSVRVRLMRSKPWSSWYVQFSVWQFPPNQVFLKVLFWAHSRSIEWRDQANKNAGAMNSLRPSQQFFLIMIAFITTKSGLVPLIEGLCSQISYCRSTLVCVHIFCFSFSKGKKNTTENAS